METETINLETKTPKKRSLTGFLVVGVIVMLMLLVLLTYLCLPYFEAGVPQLAAMSTEAPTLPPTQPPTEPPTEEPTEAPTEAPTEPLLPDEYLSPYGALDFQFEGRYLKCLRTETLTGIDVSSHQKDIDWRWVKASGVDFAMIRIAYRGYESGKIVMDSYAEANLSGAAAVGLPVGVYFFSQALNVEEAKEEAAFVLEAIAEYDITMPVVFDWEHVSDEDARSHEMDPRTLTDCALAFLGAIEEAGYTPMMYFNPYQARNDLYLEELIDYDFWLARYTKRMDFPYTVKMWQYTDSGTVPGIEGPTDINVYFVEE